MLHIASTLLSLSTFLKLASHSIAMSVGYASDVAVIEWASAVGSEVDVSLWQLNWNAYLIDRPVFRMRRF